MLTSFLRQNVRGTLQTFIVLSTALAVLAAILVADYLTPYETNLSAFYLLVPLLVSWFCGVWWGVLFACLCTLCQIQISRLTGTPYTEPVYFYIANANVFFAYLITAVLASGFRNLYVREQELVRVDFLTGVANSKAFYERLAREIAQQSRSPNPFAVAYLDCDNFKLINDRLGHQEGDRVLKTIADTLTSNVRVTDMVARLGGDEFAILCSRIDEFGALQTAGKLSRAVNAEMDRNGWPTTLSMGVGIFSASPASVDGIISFCDGLMYEAKASGRNRVCHRAYDAARNDE